MIQGAVDCSSSLEAVDWTSSLEAVDCSSSLIGLFQIMMCDWLCMFMIVLLHEYDY